MTTALSMSAALACRRSRRRTTGLRTAGAAALLLAALAPAQAQAPRRGAGSLAGRIVNQLTREPVGGARVQLVGTGVAISTDSAGRFGMDR
jgi:hypothetical protein